MYESYSTMGERGQAPPTRRMRQFLCELHALSKRDAVAPSYRELAIALGLASTSSVKQFVDDCKRRGLVKSTPGARSLKVTEWGMKFVDIEEEGSSAKQCCPNCGVHLKIVME